jgi:hypothetical protein
MIVVLTEVMFLLLIELVVYSLSSILYNILMPFFFSR